MNTISPVIDNDEFRNVTAFPTPSTALARTDNPTVNQMRTFFDNVATNFFALADQAKEFEEYKVVVADMRRELDGLRIANDQMRLQIELLVAERDSARSDASEAWAMAATYAKEKDDWKAAHDEVLKMAEDYLEKITKLSDTNTAVEATLLDTKQAHDELAKQYERLGGEHSEVTNINNTLYDQNKRQEKTIHDQIEVIGRLQTEMAEVRRDHLSAKEDAECAEGDLDYARTELGNVRAERDAALARLDRIIKSLTDLAAAA